MANGQHIQPLDSQRLASEIDEAQATVLALTESARACPPVQDGLATRLMRAAGEIAKWSHRYVQMRNLIDQLNAQISALQVVQVGIVSAVKQLSAAHEDLGQVDAFMFVCMQALQTKSGDDTGPCVSAVLSVAYDKLVLDVNRNIREAIEALDQEGAQ
jgi:hypothetical protein